MYKPFVLTALCAVAIALPSASALAQGNGHPGGPASDNGGACDILVDATPGLYGLCVAFCEAQQCVPDFTLSDPFVDCPRGSERVLENYNRKRRADDPEMPCLSGGTCPCWTPAELAALLPTEGAEMIQCESKYDFDAQQTDPERYRIQFGLAWGDWSWVTVESYLDSEDYGGCRIRTYDSASGEQTYFELPTTPTQHLVCRKMISDYVNGQSIRCFY